MGENGLEGKEKMMGERKEEREGRKREGERSESVLERGKERE